MNINENQKASTTQNAQIAAYLQAGNSITQKESYYVLMGITISAANRSK